MAYIRPVVMVFQEYAALSGVPHTARLNACIIGPCYHVLDFDIDSEKTFLGRLTPSGKGPQLFPYNYPGAIIDNDSVKVEARLVYVDVMDGAIPIKSALHNVCTFEASTFPEEVRIGDYATIEKISDGVILCDKYAIIDKNDTALTITLNNILNTAEADVGMRLLRQIDTVELPKLDENIMLQTETLGSETIAIKPLFAEISGTMRKIHEGNLYVSYRSCRQGLDRLGSVSEKDDLEGKLGALVPENPLGYGVMIALANTTTTVYYIGTKGDSLSDYLEAKDTIDDIDYVYGLVPLTQDPGILGMFKLHAEMMSLPEVGRWRVCFGNTKKPKVVVLSEGTAEIRNNSVGKPRLLFIKYGTLMGDKVSPRDEVHLVSGDGTTTRVYTVAQVIANNMLSVVEDIDPIFASGEYPFEIVTIPDKDLQARTIAAVSKAFDSRRFIHVWPDICIIDNVELPGYYLCCAIAGMTAGLPTHQGFTRISIAGISGIENSNMYFTHEQLDLIAAGGTFILCQVSPSAPPHIRHQLTTDMTVYEFRELSFVKNFDAVSYICKDALDGFLGRYNITASTMAALDTTLRAIFESLKLYVLPRIGSPVIGYSVRSVEQLIHQRDRVEIYVDVNFPYALNVVGLHLVSNPV